MPELDYNELRDIIEGKVMFRKCPNCDGTGMEYWEESEDSYDQRTISEQEWNELGGRSNFMLGDEPCSVCSGLRYVTNQLHI